MRILISGAGIGGLSTALCLEKAGHDVQLFERSSSLSEVGAGLQCGANAIKVLDYLELLPELKKVAVAPERVDFRDWQTGEVLYTSDWGTSYQQRYGAPYWHLHRADLQTCLLNSLRGKVNLGSVVKCYTESSECVSIELADGRVFSGDCFIGADGIKSTVRAQLFNSMIADNDLTHSDNTGLSFTGQKAQPKFTGHMAWRGVVRVQNLPSDFMDKIASNFMGQGKHMVIYYLRHQQLVNFVGVVQSHVPRQELESNHSWVQSAPWIDLKADFEGWHPSVQALIDAVDRDQCYRWALHDHPPFKNWSSRRVTLLGDAAHATLPYMASGAAMAIEDARVLQRALDQMGDVASGLQLYQRNRFARTAEIQSTSARLGKLYHIQNSTMLKLAFKVLHSVGKRKEGFLPRYDANSVPLV